MKTYIIDLSSDEEDNSENKKDQNFSPYKEIDSASALSHVGEFREIMLSNSLNSSFLDNETRHIHDRLLSQVQLKAVKQEPHASRREAVVWPQSLLDDQKEYQNRLYSAMKNPLNVNSSVRRTPLPVISQNIAASVEQVQQGKLSRHFWRAGNYETKASGPKFCQGAMDHVRVHPKFLHSNATSHKWAFGAIAELLDNAVDEVLNGATYVKVDKILDPRNKTSALAIQDDGGGMDPECIRHCMSLGYSRKNTNATIGQYGNGFKTSTMRLGADVIVFSRCESNNAIATQSIGLLSYTFLRETGHEDTIVPMVDYELFGDLKNPRRMIRTTINDWTKNLSTILQWSPYSSEAELLNQLNDMDSHGTKIVVYNLWLNDDGLLELDFDSDEKDIKLRDGKKLEKVEKLHSQLVEQHISNQLRYSLRAYASVLYLQMPPNFQIILRGKAVEHKSIAADLKFPEYIVYKPQIGGSSKDLGFKEASVTTTIGFTKEAPLVNVHGFNVYHKNRLIMPFWKVWQDNSSRGRGVVGVLEANFIEPAHDKQDFEKTTLMLRLETRLKQMTVEYWNLHCELIGYQRSKPRSQQKNDEGAVIASSSVAIANVQPLATIPQNFHSAAHYSGMVPTTGAMMEVMPNPSNMSSSSNQFQCSTQGVPSVQGHPSFTSSMEGGAMTHEILQAAYRASFPLLPLDTTCDIKPCITQYPRTAVALKGTELSYGTNGVKSLMDCQNRITENVDGASRSQSRNDCSGSISNTVIGAQASRLRDTIEPGHTQAPRNGFETDIVGSEGDSLKRKQTCFYSPPEQSIKKQEQSIKKQRDGIDRLRDEHCMKIQASSDEDLQINTSRLCESQFQEATAVCCRTTTNGVHVSDIVEENKELQRRCEEYQRREREWEHMVDRLERELLESKTKYIKLLKEMEDQREMQINQASTGRTNTAECHHLKLETL
ncbi:hypothetical protein O6H91_04G134500 [Diphasiastrum complanatum]|uniref:Uncharacterized protein n=3 Tax=Diphasiastrum complanatum TaxID=34168 RepID=A0ACC2E2B2_DIPCM|nr:hypothetical protein O6H91_04G134500 [Diphasiastrum complanatum]KAJ7560543.1 hypothetical protein O6H91_04G134500 [Diphasiastrum complanatum]KAJ7560544.1 hypothetical protein O6H91_04G134500 [Diphasiastrum complanatum]